MKRDIKRRLIAFAMLLSTMAGISVYAQSIVPQKDEKKGLWGYVSKDNGKWVVKPKFDEATELTMSPNSQLRGTVTQKGLKGFVDDSGKILGAGIVFEEITPMQGDAIFVKVKGKTGVSDYSGAYKVKPEIIDIAELNGEGYIANMKGKKGLLNYDGTWMFEPIYNEIDPSLDGYFLINKGGKAGISDRKGKILLDATEFTKVEPFGSLWKVYKGNKMGLYDLSASKLLVKPEYLDVRQPIVGSNGRYYPVSDKVDKWGVLNSDGNEIVSKKYSDIHQIDKPSGLLLFEGSQAKRIYFFGDKKPCKIKKFDRIKIKNGFSEIALVYDKDWSDHNLSLLELPNGSMIEGDRVSLFPFNQFTFCNGFLYSRDGSVFMSGISTPENVNGWTKVDSKIISPDSKIYNNINKNGLYLVENAPNDYRLILKNGNLTSFNVEDVEIFDSNTYAAKKDGKWGLVNQSTGNIDIPFESEEKPSLITIGENNLYKINDKNGNVGVFNPQSSSWIISPEAGAPDIQITEYFDNDKNQTGLVQVKSPNGKCGILGAKDFNWIYPFESDHSDIEYLSYEESNHSKIGFLKIKDRNGNVGVMKTKDNSWLISPESGYSEIELINLGRDGYGFRIFPKPTFILTKNGKKGIFSDTAVIVKPIYDDISIEKNYGEYSSGNFSAYLKRNGKTHLYEGSFENEIKEGVKVKEFTYSTTFNTACNLSLSIYLPNEEEATISVKVFNNNGTPAKSKSGGIFEFTEKRELKNGRGGFGDIIIFPIKEFNVGIFDRKDYYMLLTVKDSKGKAVPIYGNKKISFYIQGKWH